MKQQIVIYNMAPETPMTALCFNSGNSLIFPLNITGVIEANFGLSLAFKAL